MSRLKSLLFLLVLSLLVLVAQVPLASAVVTYAVGSCKPSLPSFTTINGALAATPAPNVVEVCPGTYAEQVVITFPVTLEGISASNLDQVIISAQSVGLGIVADDLGDTLAPQVFVSNPGGEVNLSNLIVDGSMNNVAFPDFMVGIFYLNSPGTLNHLTVQNQTAPGNRGVGVWLAGGPANPSVAVENNNLQNFEYYGINVETNSSTSELTATIKGNDLASSNATGINLGGGVTASVTGNVISGGSTGVFIGNVGGSVSGNKVVSTSNGIVLQSNGVPVTSNTIYGTSNIGISAFGSALVTGNTIVQSSRYAIEFNCFAGNIVHSNTILDAVIGLNDVPSGAVSTNTYYNVSQIKPGGSC